MTPTLVDSHCHLEFDSVDEDRAAMLARAAAAGIGTMVTICTRFSRFHEVVALTEGNPALYCSVGIHPHHVAEEAMATAMALKADFQKRLEAPGVPPEKPGPGNGIRDTFAPKRSPAWRTGAGAWAE